MSAHTSWLLLEEIFSSGSKRVDFVCFPPHFHMYAPHRLDFKKLKEMGRGGGNNKADAMRFCLIEEM